MLDKKKKVFVAMSAPHKTSFVRGKAALPGAKGKRVFVAMSGGVDSSVAALLLKEQGYDCTGVFMRCYNLDGCAVRDAEDARRVTNHLQIPFYTFDFEKEYKKRVVEYMVEGYRAGITPNPDVMCNREIKFGLFLEKALALGADFVATGHYARVEEAGGGYALYAGKDPNKDQSYFLWTLTQEQLKHCLFPVGGLLKYKVRAIAKRAGLPTADKKDSQGICFLGDISLLDFLKQYLPTKRGGVFTVEGKRIGEHEGAHFYTIGQRHIRMSNAKYQMSKMGRNREPMYVVEKNVATNTMVVAEGSDNPALYRKEVELADVHFINPAALEIGNLKLGIPVLARVRYRQPLSEAALRKSEVRSPKSKTYELTFDHPVRFVAPGQSSVFYSKEGEMLGGGIIV